MPQPIVGWAKELFGSLGKMANLPSGWDGYGAPAPAGETIALSREALEKLLLFDLRPTAVVPSVEGGVGITFRKYDRYASVEICNDGEIVVLTECRDGTKSWTIRQSEGRLHSTLSNLRAFIEYDSRPPANQWSEG